MDENYTVKATVEELKEVMSSCSDSSFCNIFIFAEEVEICCGECD